MNKATLVVGTAILSFSAGSLSSYFYVRRTLLEDFDCQLEEQVGKELSVLSQRRDETERSLREAQIRLEQLEEASVKPVVVDLDGSEKVFYNNVLPAVREFTDRLKPPVPVREAMATYQGLDPELKVEPTLDRPYQINEAMFQESVSGYNQIQLTYYAKCGTLADDRDDVIEDPKPLVGDDFHEQFGQLSGDPNVVFIRNGLRDIDFEITRSEGSYGEEVAGFDPVRDPVGDDE